MSILSGSIWVGQFLGSNQTKDLEPDFRQNVESFLTALRKSQASIRISATYRPTQRAYLMHWSWKIVKQNYDASQVPSMAGVYINWNHGDQNESKSKAQEMVNGYQINNLKVPPALKSRHTQRKAIDMNISWKNTLIIEDRDGYKSTISSVPRDGTNSELIEVGKSYDVIHFIQVNKDKPHWSTDGR